MRAYSTEVIARLWPSFIEHGRKYANSALVGLAHDSKLLGADAPEDVIARIRISLMISEAFGTRTYRFEDQAKSAAAPVFLLDHSLDGWIWICGTNIHLLSIYNEYFPLRA